MKLWEHIEIPEGGAIESNSICGICDIYGWNYSGINKEDYQGWLCWLKLPGVQWVRDYRYAPDSDNSYGWYRKVIMIRHVWLGNGRRGLNGAGWQGWKWSIGLWPIE